MNQENFDQTTKEVEENSRLADMKRIQKSTGIKHCPQCGQPLENDCAFCKTCGFKSG